ncbi:Parvulin-like PPIase [Pseudolycoriella hygida]|uniref:Parvulin-like PPIase n=1 Tax=Pseudolycoriella hygida TaxID=35572 RepID=A0A9Q0N8I3_9DIPT|nr:Parvulin-like PPIase [Pseudolycoriella hygida]
MKRTSIVFLSASLLALASIAFAEDKVVATYKGGEVTESQIMKELQPFLANQNGGDKNKSFSEFDPKLQENLVRNYIDMKLLEQEAVKSGIESSKEFQDKLNQAKKQLINQELIEQHVKANVTEKMISAEYDKLAANLKGKEEVKVSHILLPTEKEALKVKNRLNKGEKFVKLAKELSKDEGSKANGGEIGYIIPGQLVPEFEEKALSMKVNEISAPVRTQFGWHVIMVLDKRPAQIPSKEEATPGITNKLSREAVVKYIADLESKSDVKILIPKPPVSNEDTKKPNDKNDK